MLLDYAFVLEFFSNDLDFKHGSTPSAGISHIHFLDRQGTLQFLLDGRLYFSGERPQGEGNCGIQQYSLFGLLLEQLQHHVRKRQRGSVKPVSKQVVTSSSDLNAIRPALNVVRALRLQNG